MYQKFIRLLEEHNEKVSTVAKATGISESVFSNWKTRGGGMSVDNLYKIAKHFGVAIEYFLEDKNGQ